MPKASVIAARRASSSGGSGDAEIARGHPASRASGSAAGSAGVAGSAGAESACGRPAPRAAAPASSS
eukprot:11966712-Alexandrium_andersonii.AAC.1